MDRRSTERFFLVTCAAMFVFGVVLAVPGTVLALPDFVARLDLTLASRGALISSLFFGLLAGSAASGPLVDRIGRRAALAGSNALIAVCLPAFAAAPSFPPAAAALVALGLVSAAGNTAANAIASGLYPDQRARRMNIIAMAVGAGGLSVPVAVALAAGRVPGRAVIAAAGALGAAGAEAAAEAVPDVVRLAKLLVHARERRRRAGQGRVCIRAGPGGRRRRPQRARAPARAVAGWWVPTAPSGRRPSSGRSRWGPDRR